MLAWRISRVSQVRPSREILAKHSAQKIFKYDFLALHLYYIYPYYPQKYERPFKEKNPRYVFYNTTHPSFKERATHPQRESYSSFMRNHYSIFSFLLPLSYLKRKFVHKHNPHLFIVYRVFQSLENFGDLPKKADKAWRMQSDVLQDPENQRIHDSKKSVGKRSLEGSSTLGRLGLEGLLLFMYSNFILQWIDFDLDGQGVVFCRVLQFPLR